MITTCANCLNEAIYAYQVTGSYSIKYCSRHTPKFLRTPKYAGRLVKMSDIKVPEVEAKTSKKKTSTPAPAPVVEEAPVEEVVEEVVEEATPEVTEAE